jgi:hypothetical protein
MNIHVETLAAFCYMELATALAGKESVEVCHECGSAFIVHDMRQTFCDSKCATRARSRDFNRNEPS